jgi:hypothetical protein
MSQRVRLRQGSGSGPGSAPSDDDEQQGGSLTPLDSDYTPISEWSTDPSRWPAERRQRIRRNARAYIRTTLGKDPENFRITLVHPDENPDGARAYQLTDLEQAEQAENFQTNAQSADVQFRQQLYEENPEAVENLREGNLVAGATQLQGAFFFDNPVASVQEGVQGAATLPPGVDEEDYARAIQSVGNFAGGVGEGARDAVFGQVERVPVIGDDLAFAGGGAVEVAGDIFVQEPIRQGTGAFTGVDPTGDDASAEYQPTSINTAFAGLDVIGASSLARRGVSAFTPTSGADEAVSAGDDVPGAADDSADVDAAPRSADEASRSDAGDGQPNTANAETVSSTTNQAMSFSFFDEAVEGGTRAADELLSGSGRTVPDATDNIAGDTFDDLGPESGTILDEPTNVVESPSAVSRTDTAVEEEFDNLAQADQLLDESEQLIDEAIALGPDNRRIVDRATRLDEAGAVDEEGTVSLARFLDDTVDEPRPDSGDIGPLTRADEGGTFADEGDEGIGSIFADDEAAETAFEQSDNVQNTRVFPSDEVTSAGDDVDDVTASVSDEATQVSRADETGTATDEAAGGADDIGGEGGDFPFGGSTGLLAGIGGGGVLGAVAADQLLSGDTSGSAGAWGWEVVDTVREGGATGRLLVVRRGGDIRGYTVLTSRTGGGGNIVRVTPSGGVTGITITREQLNSASGDSVAHLEPVFDTQSQARTAFRTWAEESGAGQDDTRRPSAVWDGELSGPDEVAAGESAEFEASVRNSTQSATQGRFVLALQTSGGDVFRADSGRAQADPGGADTLSLELSSRVTRQLADSDVTILLVGPQGGKVASQSLSVGERGGGGGGGDTSAWQQPQRVRQLQYGWYLFARQHKSEDRTQFAVVGKRDDGTTISLTSNGSVREDTVKWHSDVETALNAYQAWVSEEQQDRHSSDNRPDPTGPSPTPEEVRNANSEGSGITGTADNLLGSLGDVAGALPWWLILAGGAGGIWWFTDGEPVEYAQKVIDDIGGGS